MEPSWSAARCDALEHRFACPHGAGRGHPGCSSWHGRGPDSNLLIPDWEDFFVADRTPFLRRPIPAVISGQECQLLTTGHLAHALGRTPRTIRTWRAMNLLPKPPFVIHAQSLRSRRWLWPSGFVNALAEIADSGRILGRMC